ncbi:MAG TPA: YdcF family protein [Spirochaetota bacterium]|nr:YdcF family protein [Spirochaetota bacterium]
MKKKIFIICIIFVFWFALHISATIADGLNDEMEISDAAVVLGNKVDPSGLPSPRLKSRLDKAIELYEKGFVKYIIVSGGKGEEGYDEALVMRKYLVSKNISYDFIIEDNNGMNSYLTAVNSKEIMRKRGFGSVIIVSQYYHLPRCKLVFRKAGIDNPRSTHSDFFELRDAYSLIREFFGFYYYLFFI